MPAYTGVAQLGNTYGVISNLEQSYSCEEATYTDADGDVAGVTTFNESEELSATFTWNGTANPVIGATVTLTVNGAPTKYIVSSLKNVETANEYRTCEVGFKRWIANTIPA